jgi:phosphoribosylformylglycinamidine (FGAM) synthase PurS component
MIDVQVLVRLATADPWSFTVLDSLRRRFGLAGITGVARLKSWEVSFDSGSADQAIGLIERLLRDTALLANPNRDVWFARADTRQGVPAPIWHRSRQVSEAFAVKVSDLDDITGRSVTEVIRSRLGMREIARVRFSTIWVLEMEADGTAGLEMARQVAVADMRRRGLLANPHCQYAEVHQAGAYLEGGGNDI